MGNAGKDFESPTKCKFAAFGREASSECGNGARTPLVPRLKSSVRFSGSLRFKRRVRDQRGFRQRLFLRGDALSKSVVCLTRLFAREGFSFGVNDFGDVRIFFDGQVDEAQPVAG